MQEDQLIIDISKEAEVLNEKKVNMLISKLDAYDVLHKERASPTFINIFRCKNSEKISSIQHAKGDKFGTEVNGFNHIKYEFQEKIQKEKIC